MSSNCTLSTPCTICTNFYMIYDVQFDDERVARELLKVCTICTPFSVLYVPNCTLSTPWFMIYDVQFDDERVAKIIKGMYVMYAPPFLYRSM